MSEVRRILIVDDDRDFSESTAAFLRAHGYRVEQAYSGGEGLKRARLRRPDVILMDVMMDERTEGFFTVQRIRRDHSLGDVPVLVISAIYEVEPGFTVEAGQGWLAHDGFLPKPLDLDLLLAAIEQCIGRDAAVRVAGPTAPAQPARPASRPDQGVDS